MVGRKNMKQTHPCIVHIQMCMGEVGVGEETEEERDIERAI